MRLLKSCRQRDKPLIITMGAAAHEASQCRNQPNAGSNDSMINFGPSPRALCGAAATLRLAAALAGRSTGFRRYASSRGMGRRRDERPQPRECLVAVARLAAMILREDHDFSGCIQTPSRSALQPGAQPLRQIRAREIQAQLDGGRNLVDVLSAGPRGAHELDRQRVFRDPGPSCYLNHCHRCTIVRSAASTQEPSGRGGGRRTRCFR